MSDLSLNTWSAFCSTYWFSTAQLPPNFKDQVSKKFIFDIFMDCFGIFWHVRSTGLVKGSRQSHNQIIFIITKCFNISFFKDPPWWIFYSLSSWVHATSLTSKANVQSINASHTWMGSHHHQRAILVPDDKLDCFGYWGKNLDWNKTV